MAKCVSTGVGAVATGMLISRSRSAMAFLCINLKGLLCVGYDTVEMQDSTHVKQASLVKMAPPVLTTMVTIRVFASLVTKGRTVNKTSMNVAQDLALTVERARISKGATDATASQASWENIVKRSSMSVSITRH